MDKHDKYRDIIKQILGEYAAYTRRAPHPGVETLEIYDEERDHYLIRHMGWSGHKRVRQLSVHVRLCGSKIHIEEDMTEQGIATDLVNAGVPKDDIVLAFQPPLLRPLTEFAVA